MGQTFRKPTWKGHHASPVHTFLGFKKSLVLNKDSTGRVHPFGNMPGPLEFPQTQQ